MFLYKTIQIINMLDFISHPLKGLADVNSFLTCFYSTFVSETCIVYIKHTCRYKMYTICL